MIAFFDVDNTLVKGSTGALVSRFFIEKGYLSTAHIFKTLYYVFLHRMNLLNYKAVVQSVLKTFEGASAEEILRLCMESFEKFIQPNIYREGMEKVKEHQQKGHSVVLISSGSPFLVGPVRDFLGAAHSITTNFVIENGRVTGEMQEPVCFGEGKRVLAENFLKENGGNFAETYFYTDSLTDFPLLAAVGYPVVVNPDPFLKRRARKLGWKVEYFKETVGGNILFNHGIF